MAESSRSARATLALSVAVVGALFALVLGLGHPAYGTSDDVGMALMVSGALTGQPNAGMFHSHILLGQLLRALYTLAPDAPWYAIYLYAVHAAAMALLLFLCLRGARPRPAALLFLGFFAVFELPALLRITFTTTAITASTVAVCGLAAALESEQRRPLLLGAGIVLLALGMMVRENSLLLVALATWPVPAALLLRAGQRRRAVLTGVAVVALLAVLHVVHGAVFAKDAEWSVWARYRKTRAVLTDYRLAYTPYTSPAFAAAGWSANDVALLAHRLGWDPGVYSLEKFEAVLAELPPARPLRDSLPHMRWSVAHARLSWPLVAVHLAVVFLLLTPRKRLLLATVTALAILLGLYVAVAMKIPPRIVTSLAFIVGCTATWCFGTTERGEDAPEAPAASGGLRRAMVLGAAALYVGLLLPYGRGVLRVREQHRAMHEAFRKLVAAFPRTPGTVYVVEGASFPTLASPPFATLNWYRELNLKIPWGGTFNPVFNQTVRSLGAPTIFRALYETPGVYLVSSSEVSLGILGFIQEHYGDAVRAHLVWASSEPMPGAHGVFGLPGHPVQVYQFVRQAP